MLVACGCGCAACMVLDDFLAHPSEKMREYSKYSDELLHIEERLKNHIRDDLVIFYRFYSQDYQIRKTHREHDIWEQSTNKHREAIASINGNILVKVLGDDYFKMKSLKAISPTPPTSFTEIFNLTSKNDFPFFSALPAPGPLQTNSLHQTVAPAKRTYITALGDNSTQLGSSAAPDGFQLPKRTRGENLPSSDFVDASLAPTPTSKQLQETIPPTARQRPPQTVSLIRFVDFDMRLIYGTASSP